MERGSLVIREIAWRVRGSQTPKRSHEETIGDTSPSVASSVLSRPSHYPLHSSHSSSVFPFLCCSLLLLHPLCHHQSAFHAVACMCTAWVFCTVSRQRHASSAVNLFISCLSSAQHKQRFMPARWKRNLSVCRKCLVWCLWHSLRWRHSWGCKGWNPWNPLGTTGTP